MIRARTNIRVTRGQFTQIESCRGLHPGSALIATSQNLAQALWPLAAVAPQQADDLLRRSDFHKGEARNALARAIFFHSLGELRDRTFENQFFRASGLNLLVAAIILWNTKYLERALAALPLQQQLIPHVMASGVKRRTILRMRVRRWRECSM